jgi:DNA-binding FadR family transcriptional regulator
VSPAHVLEPTYETIKRRLLNAYWGMGTKLEAMKLADDLGVSITPVRDSLNRLFGEHLVDFIPGEGFRVPVVNEAMLRDLLKLNCILMMTAAETSGPQSGFIMDPGMNVGERTASLFLHLSRRTANRVLISCIMSINDRLQAVRNLEMEIFADLEAELSELADACKAGKSGHSTLKELIRAYHERRIEMVSEYLKLFSDQ